MNKSPVPLVTLLTDFGTADGYVGAMKGVLMQSLPNAKLIDISHEIKPFNYRQAAFALLNYAFYYPKETIHIVVVDPGVGSERKGLVVKTSNYYFVGPDNGVFSFVYQKDKFQAYEIDLLKFGSEISATFHGRDIFVPAAVRILKKEKLEDFCHPINHVSSFYEPYSQANDGRIALKVIHIDHFGNLILNFNKSNWNDFGKPSKVKLQINDFLIFGIKHSFSDVDQGELVLIWDSQGFLQLAQNKGNAASTLQMKVGDTLRLILF